MKTASVEWIKSVLLDFHKKRGCMIFNSFPLVSRDPTVMFVNATITPFKHFFVNDERPENYAFIQRCFRMGGASELELVGTNPYYHTFFEMFGSGVFSIDYKEAVKYLLDLLVFLTLEKDKTYFAVPNETDFRNNLVANGIEPSMIFDMGDNNIFWQEWRFGKLGPVGKGLTVIYSRSPGRINSLEQVIKGSDEFIELANLIHVYGQEIENGNIIPLKNPGFEFAVGIERLAAVLQNCNNYQIDSIGPLAELVASFLEKEGSRPNETVIRLLTDHLRSICILTNEDIKPSNKRHGYVFRRLIRKTLEKSWTTVGQIYPVESLAEQFCRKFNQLNGEKISPDKVAGVITKETKVFLETIERAKRVLGKNPAVSPAVLLDTYGLPETLIHILEKGEGK